MQITSKATTPGPILVPVDFSQQSRVAVLTASELAGSSPVSLVLLHVVHENGEQIGFYREHANDYKMRTLASIADEMLENFLGELRFDHPEAVALNSAGLMTVRGLPSRRIIEVADQQDALMVVMGSRSRTGLPHWLMGSVAEQVSRHCSRPVMIIKETEFDAQRRDRLRRLHTAGSEALPVPAPAL